MENNYILITPARNEEKYIRKTIESVISQTLLPKQWIIISDGSTDHTDDIVCEYEKKFNFIRLLKITGDARRNFGSKAKAVMFAYNKFKDRDFEFVGNLDADIVLDIGYYEGIINRFLNDDRLGCAGGIRYDYCKGKFKKVQVYKNSVGGPIQFFRRKCFEEIGGYMPLKYGGIDAVAENTAKMLGWEVLTFPELIVHHLRCTGTAGKSLIKSKIKNGIK